MCSLMYGCTVTSPLMAFYRALSLRQVSWGNDRCRDVIAHYLEWVLQAHGKELEGMIYKDLNFQRVMCSYMDDDMLRQMYTGSESGVLKSAAALNKRLVMNFASDSSELKFGADVTSKFRGLPVHGQYGGPGYTGGEITERGNYDVKPTDPKDAAYREHDYGYEFGSKRNADARLGRALGQLPGARNRVESWFWSLKGFGGNPDNVPNVPGIREEADEIIHVSEWHRQDPPLEGALALVGIEPNPGPGKRKAKKKKKAKQPVRRARSLAQFSMTREPVATSVSVTIPFGKPRPETGTIRLGTVSCPVAATGAICFLGDLSPFEVGGRLANEARNWQNYRFNGGRITYIPIVASSEVGQMIVTRDRDSATWPQANIANVNEQSQKAGRMTVNVRSSWSMALAGDNRLFYTYEDPSEPRTTSPGYVQVTASSTPQVKDYGTLEFDYSYTFYNAVVRTPSSTLYLQDTHKPPDVTTSLFPLTSWEQMVRTLRLWPGMIHGNPMCIPMIIIGCGFPLMLTSLSVSIWLVRVWLL